MSENSLLCLHCLANLPETNFHLHDNNPIEKIFWGRLPVVHATAQYYFTKESRMQQLIHQLKYRGNKSLGLLLGRLVGEQLMNSNRFRFIEMLVPLPLFPAREKRRGYNQAMILCEGMAEVMQVPIAREVIVRTMQTETQTHKGRIERWKNMEGRFQLRHPEIIQDKCLLLVDDVITTGATLEACGQELLKTQGVSLHIATLCYAAR